MIALALGLCLLGEAKKNDAAYELPLQPVVKVAPASGPFEVGVRRDGQVERPATQAPSETAVPKAPPRNGALLLALRAGGGGLIGDAAQVYGQLEVGYRFAPRRRAFALSLLPSVSGSFGLMSPQVLGSELRLSVALAPSAGVDLGRGRLRLLSGVSLDWAQITEDAVTRRVTRSGGVGFLAQLGYGLALGPGWLELAFGYSVAVMAWVDGQGLGHALRATLGYVFTVGE